MSTTLSRVIALVQQPVMLAGLASAIVVTVIIARPPGQALLAS